MTVHQSIDTRPVVARAEGMFPEDLDGYEAHRKRVRGDKGNIIRSRSKLNRLLIGGSDWAVLARAEIDEMRIEAFASELEKLERRNRKGEIARRLAEGPKDPWCTTRHGPLREIVLTAHSAWFAEDPRREEAFGAAAKDWLLNTFGADVFHARVDRDESAFHVHAVIMPRDVDRHGRRVLRPSKFDVIRHYELLQDSVGHHFAQIGLVRGESRAAARRQARAAGLEPGPKRYHTRPRNWRMAEESRLIRKEAELTERTVALEAEFATQAGVAFDLVARQSDLDMAELALSDGRGALEVREDDLDVREAKVARQEEDVDAVFAATEAIADGLVEPAEMDGEVTLKPTKAASAAPSFDQVFARLKRGGKLLTRAVGAFHGAFTTMRATAEQKAEARVAQDRAEILEADDAIVAMAQDLPPENLSRISTIRRALVPMLTRWRKAVRSGGPQDDRGPESGQRR